MKQTSHEHQSLTEVQNVVIRREVCSTSSVRRIAAMLNLNPDEFVEGAPLPRGWQFILMGADTKRSQLRADGFPGLGVTMPDLGLSRLMLGSRAVTYATDIPIGAMVTRNSTIKSLTHKTTKAGPMAVVVIQNELRLDDDAALALTETQTYL